MLVCDCARLCKCVCKLVVTLEAFEMDGNSERAFALSIYFCGLQVQDKCSSVKMMRCNMQQASLNASVKEFFPNACASAPFLAHILRDDSAADWQRDCGLGRRG